MILGIGIDLTETRRIKELIKKHGASFLDRVFTEGEKSYCLGKMDPYPGFAARFAAKEALFKALGQGWPALSFTDVRIHRDDAGKPHIRLSGKALTAAERVGYARIHLSLTHENDYAQAMVILESD